jgi:hypothetical protein
VTSLGRISVADGEGRADTKLVATRDVRLMMYGGAVRACGKAGKHSQISSFFKHFQESLC